MQLTPYAKKNIKEYYRLTKPGIIYGNALSIVAGFLLACTHHFNGSLLIGSLFSICLIMASGCVFNNVLDRNIDAKMDRTKKKSHCIPEDLGQQCTYIRITSCAIWLLSAYSHN